jgi:hypothetical protein
MAAVQLGIPRRTGRSPSVAENFGFLGLIYKASEPMTAPRTAIAISIDVLGAPRRRCDRAATHLNNLGVLYKIQGNWDAAALYKEALRLRHLHFAEQSVEVVKHRSAAEATGDEGAHAEYMQAMILPEGSERAASDNKSSQ